MTDLETYLMGRDKKYPISEKQKESALELLRRVGLLFEKIGVKDPDLASGYRPSAINAKVGGAKMSAHMTCEAGDWENLNNRISDLISVALLVEFDLYMENPAFTKGWIHLQTRPTRSGNRIFNP